ncbi:MAG: zinc-binding dehydrogenase, partial [Gemmatimonadetes bacterium]|nr:zinc-binding dehydrogenase [Gemmatimonadota bacterium]
MSGHSPGAGGGWSGGFLAHVSQLHAAGSLADDVAVLADPFASALRGVLEHPPAPGDVVLVIGAGTIGLLAVRALRATGWGGEIAVLGRYPNQRELARQAGASSVFARPREVLDWAGALPDARTWRPRLAPAFVEGGPSLVFDTVGRHSSLRAALALACGGGRIVLVGAAARVRLDLTRLWYRHLTLAGIFVYGPVPFRGQPCDIFSAAVTLMHEGALEGLPLVTHHFPLADYRTAIATALDKRAGAVKVVFRHG